MAVAGTVAVAATEEEARQLLVPEAWAMAHSRTRGVFPPLDAPERIEAREMTEKQRGFYEAGLRGHVHGTEEQVAEALERAVEQTGAQEVLVTTSTYDREALSASYRRLARAVGLRPRALPERPADRTLREAPADRTLPASPADRAFPEAPADRALPEAPTRRTRPEQTPDNG